MVIAKDDVDRITHAEGVDLRGSGYDQSLAGTQGVPAEKAPRSLGRSARPGEGAGDLHAGGRQQCEGHVE
jgi:hypothetical protein